MERKQIGRNELKRSDVFLGTRTAPMVSRLRCGTGRRLGEPKGGCCRRPSVDAVHGAIGWRRDFDIVPKSSRPVNGEPRLMNRCIMSSTVGLGASAAALQNLSLDNFPNLPCHSHDAYGLEEREPCVDFVDDAMEFGVVS